MTSHPSFSLLPYQKRWIEDKARFKVAEKSRRIGLTWVEALDAVGHAGSTPKQGGSHVYYIGYNHQMALEFIEICAWWAINLNQALSPIEKEFWLGNEQERSVQTFAVKFPKSGHRITALSSRPANLRGKQGIFIIDEAAFHERLEELLKAVLATLIRQGKVRIISTHNGENNPFALLCQQIKQGQRPASLHRIPFLEAIEQGLYEQIAKKQHWSLTPDAQNDWVQSIYEFYGEDASEELDVVPRASKGAYLPATLIEPAMREELPLLHLEYSDDFALLPGAVRFGECQAWIEQHLAPLLQAVNQENWHCFGQDFARTGHLSVVCLLEIDQNLVRICRLMLEMRNVPTRQQEQILWHLITHTPKLQGGAMDAGGNGETLAEYTRDKFGTHIEGMKLNNPFYGAAMPLLKSAFEDRLLQIPRDMDLREDLRTIQVLQGIPKVACETKGADGKPRHGDTAIALLLAYHASLSEIRIYEFERLAEFDRFELQRDAEF